MAEEERIQGFTTKELEFVRDVIEKVCATFAITEEQIRTKRRFEEIVMARHCLFQVMATKTDFSHLKISQVLNPVHYKEISVDHPFYTEAMGKNKIFMSNRSNVSFSLAKTRSLIQSYEKKKCSLLDKKYVEKIQFISDQIEFLSPG